MRFDSSPAVANGMVYVGSGDGNAYAFSLKYGSQHPDVMTIADEVDSQLTQAMDSFMNVKRQPAPAAA